MGRFNLLGGQSNLLAGQNAHPVNLLFTSLIWNNKIACSDLPKGGGVLRFGLDRGLSLKPWNRYPYQRVILAEKGTPFSGIFLKI